jgi:hypothetical protein
MPTTAGSAALWWKGKKKPLVTKDNLDLPVQPVSFSEIGWADTTYRITYHRPVEKLVRSIETIGLQQAIVLQEIKSSHYRIVAGYRRLQALQKIKTGPVICRIATVDTGKKELFLFNFHENLDRGFNTVELSLVLLKLSVFFEQNELIDQYLPLLNLPPRKETLDRFLRLNEISPIYRPALLQGRLFPETVERVLRDFFPIAHLIFALFIFLHWGFQKQKEFLSDLKEICFRRQEEPEKILSVLPIEKILRHFSRTPQQKGEALRKYFKTSLFPIMTETEKCFEEIISPLNLDPRTRIYPPPFFEGGRYGLDVRFSDPNELKASLQKILQILEDGKLDGLP